MLRRILFLLVALLASGGTVLFARSWMQSQLAAREAPAPVVAEEKPLPTVLVAKAALPAGQFVRPEHLRWQPWPEHAVAENYVVPAKGRLEDFVGAVVRSGIAAGEPIVEGRVVRPGERGFMAAVLTPGYRAVTVSVTPSSGIAGFVFPGDRVDVILTVSITEDKESGKERRASETVLTDIRVLAVDQRADDQKKEVAVAKTATLEVTPKQAEIVAVVGEMGKLALSLRSLGQDEETRPSEQAHTWDSEASRVLTPVKGPNGLHRVILVRGSEKTDIEFKGIVQ